jgi:predicted homoserine dehydrogenase-like protein
MIIVDSALAAREAEGRPIRVALVGAGFMGAADQPDRQLDPWHAAGGHRQPHPRQAERAYRERQRSTIGGPTRPARSTPRSAPACPSSPRTTVPASRQAEQVDAVVEATGAVEYGCHVVATAIDHGNHVVLLNAEVDGTVGPILSRRAERNGVI